MILLCQRVENGSGKAALVRTGLPAHSHNRPLADAQGFIRNQQILIKFHLVSQSKAFRAGAEWIIEGKAPRLHLVHTDAAVRAGKILAEIHSPLLRYLHRHQPACKLHDGFNGICQTLLDSRLHNKAVHHNFDIVLDILIQLDLLRKLIEASVNSDTDIAALSRLLKHLHMLSLSSPDHRGQKLNFRPLRHLHNLIHHLVHGLAVNLSAALRTVRDSDSGIEKPHIVIDFRHSSHCRAWIWVRGLLINGNSRR